MFNKWIISGEQRIVVPGKPGPAFVKSKSLHSRPCVVSDFVLNVFVTEACEMQKHVSEVNVESMI